MPSLKDSGAPGSGSPPRLWRVACLWFLGACYTETCCSPSYQTLCICSETSINMHATINIQQYYKDFLSTGRDTVFVVIYSYIATLLPDVP